MGKGQTLEVESSGSETLHWVSLDERGEQWFEAFFQTENFDCRQNTDAAVAERLQKILLEARNLNPGFLQAAVSSQQSAVTTRLDFPREWGLGTSSTLIFNVAQWAQVDPFELQFRSFGGSGYDIACAGANQPILYQLKEGKPQWEPCPFVPAFANCLYFIYLGKKQDSRSGIAQYQKRGTVDGSRQLAVGRISRLTQEFLAAKTLAEFEALMLEHERIVGKAVQLPRAKSLFFNDFWGEIKSLGAWGGDFVLASSERSPELTRQYFSEKGCPVFFPFHELAL